MAARTGMTNLIARLRGMTGLGTADITIAGAAWWTDDQVQVVLDQHRRDLRDLVMQTAMEYDAGGTPRYYDYLVGWGNLEEWGTGIPAWNVYGSDGVQIATAGYTPDYVRGLIRFTADQAGSARYLRARSYNLNLAAADIWQQKAGQTVSLFNIDPGLYTAWVLDCNAQAKAFRRLAGVSSGTFYRNDLALREDD